MNAKLCLTFGKYILTNLIRVWTSVSGRGNLWKYQAGRKNETEFRVRSRETVISTETTAARILSLMKFREKISFERFPL